MIRDELAATERIDARRATIVFFTDFQCPFCGRTHRALAPLLEERHGRVRVVLRHVPLPRHPDARTAARAAICVERLTPELLEDYARALFEADDLSEAACEGMATERGVDAERLRRCLTEPAVDARLDADLARFDAIGGDGVPLLYVGARRIDGAPSREELAGALDEAIAARR